MVDYHKSQPFCGGREDQSQTLKDFERTFSLDFIVEPMGADSDQPGVGRMALVIMGGGCQTSTGQLMESLRNSQESVAVTVTMKITGSGATREEGRYQCLSSQPSSLPGKHALFSYHLPERITSPGPQE